MDRQRWPVSCHQVSLPHPDQTSFDRVAADCLRLRWHERNLHQQRIDLLIQADRSQPMEPAFNAARRHGYPRCKAQVPVGSIRSRYHPILGTFASLHPVDTSLPGECERLVMTGRAHAARTPTLPSYYAATASQVWASPAMGVLNPQTPPKESLTLEWQTYARYAKGHMTRRYEVPLREVIRAHF